MNYMNDKTVTLKEMAEPRIFLANSFIAPGCIGNPAGICLLPYAMDEQFYKNTAVKMGCSETAFVYEKNNVLNLRWFTRAANEVDLCGHATLALSWILWNKRYVYPDTTINYTTRSGILSASLIEQDVYMDFPVKPVTPLNSDEYPLGWLMGVNVKFLGKAWFDLLVETENEDDIKNLKPDFEALKGIPVRGIIVTARSSHKEYDFVSRFFAPSIGIDEDPVTGSAHCALADYWSKKLKKEKMIGYQASKEGGMVGVSIKNDRVTLSGKVQEVPVSGKIIAEIGI
jgi:PhzF family phenazine biosynthesis protein